LVPQREPGLKCSQVSHREIMAFNGFHVLDLLKMIIFIFPMVQSTTCFLWRASSKSAMCVFVLFFQKMPVPSSHLLQKGDPEVQPAEIEIWHEKNQTLLCVCVNIICIFILFNYIVYYIYIVYLNKFISFDRYGAYIYNIHM
jgi:hypothetical protein